MSPQRLKKATFRLWLLLVATGLASQVRAQGPVIAGVAPVVEGSIGFSYMQSSVPSEGNLPMSGILATASGDLNAHFAVKLELGYSRSFDAFQTGRRADILTYMAGPVFYPVHRSKFDIHAQVLVGGARETGVNFENDGTLVRGYVNQFAWSGGVGIQYRISEAFSVRPEVEYIRTAYFNPNVAVQGQPNLRTSLNLIYTFGRRE
jgi:opacity protein-like surface antigen